MQRDFESLTDDELALLCKQGVEGAFCAIYERYKQKVINFSYQMLRDRDAAADILQETFQYFFRKIPEYRPEGKLHILLLRVARNICIGRLKRLRRAKELPLEEAAVLTEKSEDSASPNLEKRELSERVGAALEMIPLVYSEVIILRILKELSIARVSEILDCPEGTVKSRLHNGLELLRKTLKKSDFK